MAGEDWWDDDGTIDGTNWRERDQCKTAIVKTAGIIIKDGGKHGVEKFFKVDGPSKSIKVDGKLDGPWFLVD